MLKMSAVTLDKLPAEILEGIFAELEHDRDTLDTLGLACHVLLARTRPHRFPIITLHNYNFDNFMDLTYASPWNTILPHVKQLVLGTTMFPLSHCYPGKRTTDGELLARDLTTWAAQFDVLQSLDLCGAFWPALPQYFKNALLSLRVEHLRVCLVENSLTVTDFRTVVFPTIRPKSLSISGPLWRRKLAPFYPTYFPETPPFYIHYLQLDEAKPIQEIIDWLRHHDPPPPIIHLYVELPGWQDSPLGHLIIEILHLISPVHLQLKLPTVVTECFEFPIETFTCLRSIQISSLYNDKYRTPLSLSDSSVIGDLPVATSILQQFAALQDRIENVQLDSVCNHLNIFFGNIPEILQTSYLSLKTLTLTLRSGKAMRRKQLEEWLDQSPFAPLRSRGVELKIETV